MSRLTSALADISVTPDLRGLPAPIVQGLQHLTNNLAGIMFLIAALGIVGSLIGLLVGQQTHSHAVSERSRKGLAVSISAGAILYLGVAAANYATGLFR